MEQKGILVDFQWCSGCHSCELACKNEKGFGIDQDVYGMKLLELGPYQLDEGSDRFEWNYIPIATSLCDLCEERVRETGEEPPCVFTCLAQCLTYGTLDELSEKLKEKGKRAYLIVP